MSARVLLSSRPYHDAAREVLEDVSTWEEVAFEHSINLYYVLPND